MKKILTVSIAAYNAEKYIAQTLDSLLIPEVIDKLEVFVVDDGGTDRTLEIAQKYAERYPDSIFPVHKKNEGYGTTVNYSIAHASGKYFKCLDGDDWFDKEGLRKLVAVLETSDADVVVTNFYRGCDRQNCKKICSVEEKTDGTIPIREINIKNAYGMWMLTFKTRLLAGSGLELPGHRLYTDLIFDTVPFAYAKTIRLLTDCVYCYRIGRDGQSVSRESRVRNRSDILKNCEDICEFYEQNKACGNSEYLKLRVTACYCTAVKTLLVCPVSKETLKEIQNFENKIHALSKDIYENAERYKKIGKVIFLLRKTHYFTYWMLKFIPGGFPNFY